MTTLAKDLVCISPVDGRVVARRPVATEAEIVAALAGARAAQREWAHTPLQERVEYIGRFLEALAEMNNEIVSELAWQMGRPVRYCGELSSLRERAEAMVRLAERALANELAESQATAVRYVSKQAAGLVLVIAPWNYPYLTAANTIIPALLAGNAVILKHASQTLLVGERLAEAFAASGLPQGLFANLALSHEDTGRLLAAGHFDHATFTGSVEGGRSIERAAAGSLTSLTLELGGKDPAYVRADADLDRAAVDLADGAFYNSGQCCCGVERIYVHRGVWNEFLDRFTAAAASNVLGNPFDAATSLGPMAQARLAQTVREQVDEAVSQGAQALIDRDAFPEDPGAGPYLMPQVLTNVHHQMRVMREETFGPVAGLMAVDNDDEAVRLMNDSSFGLTASVWTSDLELAEQIGHRIETGTVFMNRCDYVDPGLVWTGVKQTGRGASLGRFGFDAVTRPKAFHLREI